jgi:hypothetical protein
MLYGYYPQDPNQAQICDMVIDTYTDIFNLVTNIVVTPPGDQQNQLA